MNVKELVEKMKQIIALYKEVNEEIETCGDIDSWQLYSVKDFKQVCRELGIGYKILNTPYLKGKHFEAYYDGLRICCVGDLL
jgi:hypothetical protein